MQVITNKLCAGLLGLTYLFLGTACQEAPPKNTVTVTLVDCPTPLTPDSLYNAYLDTLMQEANDRLLCFQIVNRYEEPVYSYTNAYIVPLFPSILQYYHNEEMVPKIHCGWSFSDKYFFQKSKAEMVFLFQPHNRHPTDSTFAVFSFYRTTDTTKADFVKVKIQAY
ncbi:MAG: hypothetical protein LAT76_06060 [Schleiferiaceae bacterium]|nr:hypothetical protein [Schleiferiaceae bacterium]